MNAAIISNAFKLACMEWSQLLGSAQVLTSHENLERYKQNTEALTRPLLAALKLGSASQISEAIKIAAKHGIKVYPISTGKNWGYGTAMPADDHCVIFDLSPMNKIVSFDRNLGVITVEPGVTQQMLYDFLLKEDDEYLVPVTGAGPHTSILANALERGYGIAPYADHFQALMSLKAILPDGSLYGSVFDERNATDINNSFKWGVGPYLDGLFTQSNLGIVTQVTIALYPKPENIEAFFFELKNEENLEKAIELVRVVLKSHGANLGSVNLMNARRVLSKVCRYPDFFINSGEILSRPLLKEFQKQYRIPDWTGAGAMYGTREVTAAVKRELKRKLKPWVKNLRFVTRGKINFLEKVVKLLPKSLTGHWVTLIQLAKKGVENMCGIPNEVSLPLCYWRGGRKLEGKTDMNPARDGCGLLWYTPIVSMDPQKVRDYVKMVEAVCQENGIEPLITLTSLSNRCFDSSVPILFDPSNAEEAARAHACYDALFHEGEKMGFLPYRMGAHSMNYLTDKQSVFFNLVSKIKGALDERNILAPKRYAK